MKLVSKLFIILLSTLALFCFTMGGLTISAKAEEISVQTTLQAINLTLDETQVRIGLEDNGDGGQKATDYEENGIKFVVKMSTEDYAKLPTDRNIVFGVLVLPKDYNDEVPVTEDSVFGLTPSYAFEEDNNADTKQIVKIETDDLAYSDNSTPEDTSDDFYYYYVSMINLKENNKDREFMAFPYVKSRINGFDGGEFVYDIKEQTKTESMAYLAQKKVEDTSIDAILKQALQENYIDGLSSKVNIKVATNYNSVYRNQIEQFELPLGTVLDVEQVKQNILSKGYDFTKYNQVDAKILVGGEEVPNAKIYANNKTNAEFVLELLPTNADQQAYETLANYYKSSTFQSFILNEDGSALLNVDYGFKAPIKTGEYSLYSDGGLVLSVNDTNYFGNYLDAVSLTIDNQEHKYSISDINELTEDGYNNVSGVYIVKDTDTKIKLNADGTLMDGLKSGGSYVLAYDKDTNKVKITISALAGDTYSSELEYEEGVGFKFISGENTFVTNGKTVARPEDYAAFAGTYSTNDLHYRHDSLKGEDKWISAETYNGYLTFNKDGTLIYKGADQISAQYFVWQTNSGPALLKDLKYGNYVLYTDGTIEMFIPQLVDNSNKSNQVFVDAIINATFNDSNNTVTADYSALRDWDEEVIYSKTSGGSSDIDINSIEFREKLLDDFTNDWTSDGTADCPFTDEKTNVSWYADYSNVFRLNPAVKYTHFGFFGNGSCFMYTGHTLFGTFTMNPITEKFGTIDIVFTGYGTTIWSDNAISSIFNPIIRTDRIYYHDNGNGTFNLMIDYSDDARPLHGFNTGNGYNYYELAKPWSGVSPDPLQHYDLLTDGAGTVETPKTKTYYSNNSTLQLINDGMLKVVSSTKDGEDVGYNQATAGKAVFNDGEKDINSLFNLVPMEFTSNLESGLFFMQLSDTCSKKTEENANEFIEGTYAKVNGVINIKFNYNGVDYNFTDEKPISYVGTYIGNGEPLVLNEDLSAKLGDETGTYAITGNSIVITTDKTLKGELKVINNSVKIVFNSKIYIKQQLSLEELYAKYAGTYTADYVAKYEGKTVNATMKMVLYDNGRFSATGDGNAIDFSTQKYGSEDEFWFCEYGHLGNTANVGTYSFELINGKLKITFKFFVSSPSSGVNGNSGYASFVMVTNGVLMPGYKIGVTCPSTFYTTTAWSTYSYAEGYVLEDGFAVNFQGFSSAPVMLTKQSDAEVVSKFISDKLPSNAYQGKKITILGDSITYGVGATKPSDRYATVLCNMLGATENNLGLSGTTLCSGGDRRCRIEDIKNIPLDSDVVIVMLGTNDYNLATDSLYALGTKGDTTTDTVWGAAEEMCKILYNRFYNTGTKVYVMTPPIIKGQDNDTLNNAGYSLRDYSNVIMECAEKYGIVYYDLNASGVLNDDDMDDKLHPNSSGYAKIAQVFADFIIDNYHYYWQE